MYFPVLRFIFKVCTIKVPTPLSPVLKVETKPTESDEKPVKHFPLLIKLMIDGNTIPFANAVDDARTSDAMNSLSKSREIRREYDALFESSLTKNKLQCYFLQQMSKYMKERDYPSLLIEGTKKNWLKYLLSAVPYFPLNVFGV